MDFPDRNKVCKWSMGVQMGVGVQIFLEIDVPAT